MVRMKVVEVARTKTLIQLISWNRACPPIGEFKMFAIVLQLIYSDWTELLRLKAQLDILHRRAESGCDHMLLDLSIPCSDWCKILLEPRLCLLKLTAKKTRRILNYRLSVFRLMHVSKRLLNELFANMETKSWGWCGRKGIEARRERHWLVPVLRLSYLNAK